MPCNCCGTNRAGALKTRRWQTLRAWYIRNCGTTTCTICGSDIDFDAPGRSPAAPSVDHRVPRSRGGCIWDPTNLRLVHYGCNSRKKDKVEVKRLVRSQRW